MMINGIQILAKWIRHRELLTDADGCRILDFAMSRHSAGSLSAWVVIHGVLGAFAQENASVSFQVAKKIGALQRFTLQIL